MTKRLITPIDDAQIQQIRAGDTVLLSGRIYTARDAAHKRLLALLAAGEPLPIELKDTVVYYAGPCPAPPGMPIGSCGPTTSSRMDAMSPTLIRLGQRVLIGKGPRSQEVLDTLRECGGIYLAAVGGAGALYARCVRSSRVVGFEELGAESIKELEVEDMPLIACTDLYGGNLFKSGPARFIQEP